jgi:hypothetical protein
MLKKEVIKKELIANAMKNNVDISINNEFDYFTINFTDNRFKFLEDYRSKYAEIFSTESETLWDLEYIFHNFCNNIVNKFFENNKLRLSFGSKNTEVKFRTFDSIDHMDTIHCSICASVDIDNSSFNDIITDLIDIDEFNKLYISDTDKLIKEYAEFFQSDRFFEDVCYITNIIVDQLDHDWDTIHENLHFDMIKANSIAHKGINKLQKRCKLNITDFEEEVA